MLSRIAEDLFWLGRYVERAENVARFVDVHYHARLEQAAAPVLAWEPIVAVSGDDRLFRERYGSFTEANVLAFLATDPDCPNSVAACVARARENARSVREYISVEMWEEINKFYLLAGAAGRQGLAAAAEPHAFFEEVKTRSHLFFGVTDATLLHDEGWHFLRAGAFLERAGQTARLLALQSHLMAEGGAPHSWIAVLKSCSALEAYRRIFGAAYSPLRAIDLLLLNPEFPRSAYFSASQVSAALKAVAGSGPERYSTRAEREAVRLTSHLAVSTPEDVWAGGLQRFLEGVIASTHAVAEAIAHDFFLGGAP